MVFINKEQLSSVEYLIRQSIVGNHLLFDPDVLRRTFTCPKPSADNQMVESHIEKMMALPTLAQKRAFLEKLEPVILESVIRTYFNIVENNLLEHSEEYH
jgi:hypothetical protein